MNDFKQGDRVKSARDEKIEGVVLKLLSDNKGQVGWDHGGYEPVSLNQLIVVNPPPAISRLPQDGRDILQALHEKRTTEGRELAHGFLLLYGYITAEHKLTPYGRYVTQQWIEAGKPVDEPVVEAQESTPPDVVKQPETVTLPSALGGDDLTRNQEFAELKRANAELEAENERLKEANTLLTDTNRIKNDEINLMVHEIEGLKKTVERQRLELIDAKTNRLTLKPVDTTVHRHLFTLMCRFNDMVGELRLEFLPALEQPQAEASVMVVQTDSIFETAEEELDAYDQQLAAATIGFIDHMRQQRKLQNAS